MNVRLIMSHSMQYTIWLTKKISMLIKAVISKTFAILSIGAVFLFIMSTGVPEDLPPQVVDGCTEEVYVFPKPQQSLWQECHADDNSTAWKRISQTFHTADNPPDIITKCGKVKPRLISVNKIQQRDEQFTAVPNIVHFITGAIEFTFLNYLSVLSVHQFVKPRFIFFHGDGHPSGYWWDSAMTVVPNIYFVERSIPTWIQGYKTLWIQHGTDLMRLQILLDNGGIYLDTDVLVMKSYRPLMDNDVSMGYLSPYVVTNGVVLARPNSPLICMWLQNFHTYRPNIFSYTKWGPMAGYSLVQEYPSLAHMEEGTIDQPNAYHVAQLFRGHFDWSASYSAHIWRRIGNVPQGPEEINQLDTTLGEIMRHIYYGNKSMVFGDKQTEQDIDYGITRGLDFWESMNAALVV